MAEARVSCSRVTLVHLKHQSIVQISIGDGLTTNEHVSPSMANIQMCDQYSSNHCFYHNYFACSADCLRSIHFAERLPIENWPWVIRMCLYTGTTGIALSKLFCPRKCPSHLAFSAIFGIPWPTATSLRVYSSITELRLRPMPSNALDAVT